MTTAQRLPIASYLKVIVISLALGLLLLGAAGRPIYASPLPALSAQSDSQSDPDQTARIAEYDTRNLELLRLMEERASLESTVADAMAAERAAGSRLAEAELLLAQLVRARTETTIQGAAYAEVLASWEVRTPALMSLAARLDRRIEAHDRWQHEGHSPRALSVRGFRAALSARERTLHERLETEHEIQGARQEEANGVLRLGRLNTEIVTHERQADALSRQIGSVRARALRASTRLSAVQKEGLELSVSIQAQAQALRQAGYAVGVAAVSSGRLPLPEPVQWSPTPAKGYSLPAGAIAQSLKGGEPIRLDAAQFRASHLFGVQWQTPARGLVTTPFGEATPYQAAHWALDIGTRLYEPVVAAADGVVEFADLAVGENRLASYGLVLMIRHSERLTSLYAHLDDRAHGLTVRPGELVRRGQVLGYVGLTGYSTGPHIHFEGRLDGQPFDPLLVLQA